MRMFKHEDCKQLIKIELFYDSVFRLIQRLCRLINIKNSKLAKTNTLFSLYCFCRHVCRRCAPWVPLLGPLDPFG